MVNNKYDIAWNKANGKNHKNEDTHLHIPQPPTVVCIKRLNDGCVAVDNDHKWNLESKKCQGDEVVELEER